MENAKQRFYRMNILKWLGLVFGGIMMVCTRDAFGEAWSYVLGLIAAVGFFTICQKEAREIICKFVADDLKEVIEQAGHRHCVVEIKSIHTGLVTRIYLIGAGRLAARYGRTIISHISESWYHKSVWATQLVELEHESELEEAQSFLDEKLLEDIKRMRGERWDHGRDGSGLTFEEKKRSMEALRAKREAEKAQQNQVDEQAKDPGADHKSKE